MLTAADLVATFRFALAGAIAAMSYDGNLLDVLHADIGRDEQPVDPLSCTGPVLARG
ncbi:MAG: hypothetical protein M3171_10600 [Actinomycetota bacterium]|nr:hypothetical protein [Actinomycetota bacterium]